MINKSNKENLILNYLKDNLSIKRYNHSISVAITAVDLATCYNENINDAKIAGLLHDMAKEIDIKNQFYMIKKYGCELNDSDIKTPAIIHGYLGAYMSRDLFDVNENVFNAIRTHSMGEPNMSLLQKIIFIADYIEPFRNIIDNIDYLRKLAFDNIDACVLKVLEQTLTYLTNSNSQIHCNTYSTLEYYKKTIKG